TFHRRFTVWLVTPPTDALVAVATTPASITILFANRLPVDMTLTLLPATRMYLVGVLVTRSPLIAPAMSTLPMVGTVPYEMYDVPSAGAPGTAQPLLAMNSLMLVVLLRSAPIRPRPPPVVGGTTIRAPAPTTMPLAFDTKIE